MVHRGLPPFPKPTRFQLGGFSWLQAAAPYHGGRMRVARVVPVRAPPPVTPVIPVLHDGVQRNPPPPEACQILQM
jgi:hypothetical protein